VVRILIAATPDGAITLERILQGYECSLVTTLMAAEKQLNADAFDLIVASLHFDDSQMFAFISEVKKSQKNSDKPIICFCARDTPMSRLTLDTILYLTG
jgi:DNA-binding response OmpR family regulator